MKPILLICLLFANTIGIRAQEFESSNLPIIVIDTHGEEIIDEPKIPADMFIINNGPGVRNSLGDPYEFSGRIGIEIRGSSSQMFPKKQYGVETRDEADEGIDVSLLGLPEEEDWVLFAPYNDKSLMRDALAYKLGRDLGRYAPRTRYCEVVLNGSYNGVYVLIEKIKRDGNRVDIAKLEPEEVLGEDLTGGYIIKIDKTEGDSGPGWNSAYPPPFRSGNQLITFQYEYPKWDEIVPEQKQYIQQFMANFENALADENFKDPVNGYSRYIDLDSFVDYFIMNEVTKNVDGYRLSTFMYKDKDRDSEPGRLCMGPIWDFNLGFGNVDYCTSGNPEGFVVDFNAVCNQDFWLIPFWWQRLLADDAFHDRLVTRWTELRAGKFKTETILDYVDSVANVLDEEAQQRNFERWPVLGTYVWPNYFVGSTFQQEVEWLKDWIASRMEWLDANIPNLVTSIGNNDVNDAPFAVFPNPFSRELYVEQHLRVPSEVNIELFDNNGRILQSKERPYQSGLLMESLGTDLPPGMYFYRIRLNGQIVQRGRVVKLKE